MESTDLNKPQGLESGPENVESTSEKSAITETNAEMTNESVETEDESSMEQFKAESVAKELVSGAESEETADKTKVVSGESKPDENIEDKSETPEESVTGEPDEKSEETPELSEKDDGNPETDKKEEETESVTDEIEESEPAQPEETDNETAEEQDESVTQETTGETEVTDAKESDKADDSETEDKTETSEEPVTGEPDEKTGETPELSEKDNNKSKTNKKEEETESATDEIEEPEQAQPKETESETAVEQNESIAQETTEETEITDAEEPDKADDLETEDKTEKITEPDKVSDKGEEEKKDDESDEAAAVESKEETADGESDVKSQDKEVTTVKKEKTVAAVPLIVPGKKEKPAYHTYSQIELVNALREILDNNSDHDIREEVEAVKAAFYRKVKSEEEEQRKQFVEEYGDAMEFEPEPSPYEQDIKDLLRRYRQIRHEYNKKLEEEKEINLQLKYDIIEEIKNLINKEESINKTFQEFRNLQQRWREIGLVPQSKMKDLWNNYHFHVENFYDYIKINKELRDLDLKKNLEIKIRLCEQAEELLLEPNTIKAFNELQKLHERWREVGPVPHENKDDIWERFKASTSKINKKHQEYFENRKAEQRKNLEAKRALCEQIEEINELEISTHKEWAEKSKKVINLQKVWRTIGFATQKENNRIYKRFRLACDKFFDNRREFYSKNKEFQQNNLQMKTELCLQAEALKDSEDWHKTTQDLINFQKQWKEIGPVPRKHSDALWKRFRAACDHFFDKKSEHFSIVDSEQSDNLKAKEQLMSEVENIHSSGSADQNLKSLKDYQRIWLEFGHVPFRKKDEVQRKFRDAINKLFDAFKIDESKREILRFKSKITSYLDTSRGQNKMRFERDKYMTKLKQLENDLVLLDNNIGFFTKSKNAENLIKDVKRQIEQTKEKIEVLKQKIRLIDEMDQSDE